MLSEFAAARPAAVRPLLPAWLGSTVADPDAAAAVVAAVEAWLADVDDEGIARILGRLASLGTPGEDHPADPAVRALSRAYTGCLTAPGSGVDGLDHLRSAHAAAGGRLLLVGNHLSYVDAQLTDALLAAEPAGRAAADALAVVAGPKVYDTPFRRLAALGLHTVATAQASGISDRASLREVARVAGRALRRAQALVSEGHPVLLYAEGTRSRTGRLQPFLRGAGRYAAVDGALVLPVALDGSDRVFPVDQERLRPAVVRLAFGPAFSPAGLSRDEVMARARTGLLDLLPPERQPAD